MLILGFGMKTTLCIEMILITIATVVMVPFAESSQTPNKTIRLCLHRSPYYKYSVNCPAQRVVSLSRIHLIRGLCHNSPICCGGHTLSICVLPLNITQCTSSLMSIHGIHVCDIELDAQTNRSSECGNFNYINIEYTCLHYASVCFRERVNISCAGSEGLVRVVGAVYGDGGCHITPPINAITKCGVDIAKNYPVYYTEIVNTCDGYKICLDFKARDVTSYWARHSNPCGRGSFEYIIVNYICDNRLQGADNYPKHVTSNKLSTTHHELPLTSMSPMTSIVVPSLANESINEPINLGPDQSEIPWIFYVSVSISLAVIAIGVVIIIFVRRYRQSKRCGEKPPDNTYEEASILPCGPSDDINIYQDVNYDVIPNEYAKSDHSDDMYDYTTIRSNQTGNILSQEAVSFSALLQNEAGCDTELYETTMVDNTEYGSTDCLPTPFAQPAASRPTTAATTATGFSTSSCPTSIHEQPGQVVGQEEYAVVNKPRTT